MAGKTPRGIRNHNPGNLRRTSDDWLGLAPEQPDRDFFTFMNPSYGIRAMVRVLLKYQSKHKLKSVRQIINKWAPPVENDTDAYVGAVARSIGVKPDQSLYLLDYRVMRPLVEAIIRHENGVQPYPDDVIDEGLRFAGVDKLPISTRKK